MDSFLADATMVLHFGFLVYLVVGGFIAWRWRWTIITHVAAATWGVVIIVFSLTCPLTPLEDYFRERAGQRTLGTDGFINTYLTGVVYPEQHVGLVRAAVAVAVLVSWLGFAVIVRRRRARRGRRRAAHPA